MRETSASTLLDVSHTMHETSVHTFDFVTVSNTINRRQHELLSLGSSHYCFVSQSSIECFKTIGLGYLVRFNSQCFLAVVSWPKIIKILHKLLIESNGTQQNVWPPKYICFAWFHHSVFLQSVWTQTDNNTLLITNSPLILVVSVYRYFIRVNSVLRFFCCTSSSFIILLLFLFRFVSYRSQILCDSHCLNVYTTTYNNDYSLNVHLSDDNNNSKYVQL